MSFLFECWVFSTTLEEVLKSRLLVSKNLLSRHTRNIIQKSKFRLFFHFSQFCIGLNIAYFCLALVILIGTPTQNVIIDKPHTAERLSKQFSLFIGWVKAEFIIKNVIFQLNNMAFPPCPKVHGFHATKD